MPSVLDDKGLAGMLESSNMAVMTSCKNKHMDSARHVMLFKLRIISMRFPLQKKFNFKNILCHSTRTSFICSVESGRVSVGTREVTSATRVKTFLKDREFSRFLKVSMVVRT